MSLNRIERGATRDELNANLVLSGLTPDDIATALQWNPIRTEAALSVSGTEPRDDWLVRDYLEVSITAAGHAPVPYSSLTEQMRGAAESWFGLVDVADVVKGDPR